MRELTFDETENVGGAGLDQLIFLGIKITAIEYGLTVASVISALSASAGFGFGIGCLINWFQEATGADPGYYGNWLYDLVHGESSGR